MADYDKGQLRREYLPTGQPTGRFEAVEDIKTVALGKDQTRVTTKVEKADGTYFVKVEIMEVDINAGMASSGMRTVRQEVVERG